MSESNENGSITIRDARRQVGLKADELCALTGISPSAMSRLERGHAKLTPGYAARISAALGVDEAALRTGQKRVEQAMLKSLSARVAAADGEEANNAAP